MDPKKLGDFAGRLKSGGKGMGAGFGLLAVAGGLMYGASQAFYTGIFICKRDIVIYVREVTHLFNAVESTPTLMRSNG